MLGRPDLVDLALRQQPLVVVPGHGRASLVDLAHGDAALDRADQAAHVAADTGLVLDREPVDDISPGPGQDGVAARVEQAIEGRPRCDEVVQGDLVPADRLVATVLAGDVTESTVDALRLVDL